MANLDLRPAHLPITVYYKGDVSMQFSFTSGGVLYPLTSVTAANFVISEKNGTTAINLSSGSGLTITAAAGTIDLAITHAQIVALATQEYNYEFYLTLSGGDVWPILDSFFNVSEDGQVSVTSSDVAVSLDGSNVDVSIVAPAASGGGTWGSITGTLSDQTDLQSELDGKAAASHTHALSDISQSSATSGQVAKWNGTAWAAANESGGSDGNGIYTGSGTIPDGTAASLAAAGQFTINYANTGLPALWAIDGGSVQLRSPDGNVRIQVDNNQAEIESDTGFRLTIDGSSGTAGQYLAAQGDGTADWAAVSGTLPVGGDAGQVLAKIDGTDYNTEWVNQSGGGGASITDITYADMQTALTGGTLTEGAFYRITDAAGTDFGFVCQAIKTNEITVNGTGGYLNADFQAVGDYSGAEAVTGVTPGTQLGIWRTGFEVITIPYTNLSGGTFTVGDTITGGTTGATAVIATDDGASSMTAYMTSAGVAFNGSEVLDNGSGVTADQDGAAGSPTIVQGDVVIWNLLHWQLTDATLLDGTDPATNTAAYTQLLKTDAGQGYIAAWDVSEFDFPNNKITRRKDLRGNIAEGDNVSKFTFGNDLFVNNIMYSGGEIDQKNWIGVLQENIIYSGGSIKNCTGQTSSEIGGNTLNIGASIENITMGSDTYLGGNFLFRGAQAVNITLENNAAFQSNTLFISSICDGIVLGDGSNVANNILENGGSLTGITAGANCSISRNKIGQGATLGGSTTMGDGTVWDDCNLGASANMGTITAATNNILSGNVLQQGASISDVIITGDGQEFSYNNLPPFYSMSMIRLNDTALFTGNSLFMNGSGTGITFSGSSVFSGNLATAEGLNNEYSFTDIEISGKINQPGFSSFEATIDIDGVAAIDCTEKNRHVGVFNITSPNATESIDTITNPPTAFPFTIRPAAGLVLTITGTAYSGIAAGQIALKATDYVLDGDKGEYIVLEIDPRGTGCLVEKHVGNGLI